MNIHTPYTYFIKWNNINKSYYGVRFAKNCHPQDFWKTYFTSSKKVKKLRESFGEPDIIKIHKIFTLSDDARNFEQNVLIFLNVGRNDLWLNSSKGKCPTRLGIPFSEESKQKSSNTQKGRVFSSEHRKKLSESKKLILRGPRSIEDKEKISNSLKGKKKEPRSIETKEKLSLANKGKILTDETKLKISNARKGKSTLVKDTKWWINENGERKRSASCPGIGWTLGMK